MPSNQKQLIWSRIMSPLMIPSPNPRQAAGRQPNATAGKDSYTRRLFAGGYLYSCIVRKEPVLCT